MQPVTMTRLFTRSRRGRRWKSACQVAPVSARVLQRVGLCQSLHGTITMPDLKAYATPVVDSTAVFKDGLFKGKVLFCTGGGSGICKEMTRAVVRALASHVRHHTSQPT